MGCSLPLWGELEGGWIVHYFFLLLTEHHQQKQTGSNGNGRGDVNPALAMRFLIRCTHIRQMSHNAVRQFVGVVDDGLWLMAQPFEYVVRLIHSLIL